MEYSNPQRQTKPKQRPIGLTGITWSAIVLVVYFCWSIQARADQAQADQAQANDEPIITEKSFWVDESAIATSTGAVDAFQRGAFKPFSSGLSEGFVHRPVWVRLDLRAGQPDGEDWVIRVRPPWHDEIKLYAPSIQEESLAVSGAQYERAREGYRSLNINLRIKQRSEPQTLYLRITTEHSMLLHVEVLSLTDIAHSDQRQGVWFGFYFAFLMVIFVIGFITWLRDRERVLGAFCVQLALSILYAGFMFGIARALLAPHLPIQWIDHLTTLLIIVYPMSVLWFYREFYVDYGLGQWPRRAIDVFVAAGLVSLALVATGQTGLALEANAAILALSSPVLLATPWVFLSTKRALKPGQLPLWWIRIVATTLLILAFSGVSGTLVSDGEGVVMINQFLFHAVLLAVFMSFVLQNRARQRVVALASARAASAKQAEVEHAARKALQQFMSMFGHEVKTSLSAASLAIEQGIGDPKLAKQGAQAIDNIDTLVVRCLQADRVDDGAMPLALQRFDLHPTLSDSVAHIKNTERLYWLGDFGGVVLADPWLSGIIFSNLAENALKYGRADVPVEIGAATTSEGDLYVTVCNAVDRQDLFDIDRVFEKFYRSEYATRHSGAGLGLYLAKALAEQQGGDLSVQIDHQHRVTFYWTLKR